MYHRLRDYPPRNGTDHAFVNAPFSIYTAYYLFVVLWQVFQFSGETKANHIVSSSNNHLIQLIYDNTLYIIIGTYIYYCRHWICFSSFS